MWWGDIGQEGVILSWVKIFPGGNLARALNPSALTTRPPPAFTGKKVDTLQNTLSPRK